MKFELTRSYYVGSTIIVNEPDLDTVLRKYNNGEYNQKLDEEDKSYVPDSVDIEVLLEETGKTVYSSD